MDHKGKIHIIDDEPIIYEVLQDLLTSEGYEVEISSNGKEAIEKYKKGELNETEAPNVGSHSGMGR